MSFTQLYLLSPVPSIPRDQGPQQEQVQAFPGVYPYPDLSSPPRTTNRALSGCQYLTDIAGQDGLVMGEGILGVGVFY